MSRPVLVVSVLLLVAGVTSGGLGLFLWGTDTCESGYGVTISELGENETAAPTAEHVAFSNLSATERQVFKEILAVETTPVYQNSTLVDGLEQKVVTYRGERYETGAGFVSDCAPVWPLFIVGGGFTAILGGGIAGATYGWWRFRP